VCGWVVFRAAGLSQALSDLKVMFGVSMKGQHFPVVNELAIYYVKDIWSVLILCVLASTPILTALAAHAKKGSLNLNKTWDVLRTAGLIVLFVICISYTVNGSYNPFIYFNF
jgi:hypothetical protein